MFLVDVSVRLSVSPLDRRLDLLTEDDDFLKEEDVSLLAAMEEPTAGFKYLEGILGEEGREGGREGGRERERGRAY